MVEKKIFLAGYLLETTWQLCKLAEKCRAIVFNTGKMVYSATDAVLGLS